MTIAGRTNVASARFGRGVAEGIGSQIGRFLVTTMPVPWRVAKDRIGGRPEAVLFVESMEIEILERQLTEAPECDTILAVGGGQAIDLGKFIAWKRGLRLVTVPTALSVDAFVTPSAGIRRDHRVEYVGETTPDPLVTDYDLLRTAPSELNVGGVGDLLSIHTATFDWEIADRAGKAGSEPFSADDVAQARAILRDVEDAADAIRSVEDDGLRAIVEGYMRVNTICLPAGHYRVEEGSEHYLFYELEERLRRPFLHGQIIGLGVYLMSRLQDNEHEWITDLMNRLGLWFHPAEMDLPRSALVASLKALAGYVRKRKFWHTVIDEREITDAWIQEALADLRFP